MEAILPILLLFIGIAVGVRLLAGSMDGSRIDEYVHRRGGRVLDRHWSPFGRGWFGEKSDRIYQVRYADSAGNVHEATVKTSLFSGVYFTEDRIVETATPRRVEAQPVESLEEENRRLRAELEELRRRSQQ